MTAPIAGGMIAEASPIRIWARITDASAGKAAMRMQPVAMTRPDTPMRRRFMRSVSTRRPAGIWKIAAATLLVAIATPIAPARQCWLPAR